MVNHVLAGQIIVMLKELLTILIKFAPSDVFFKTICSIDILDALVALAIVGFMEQTVHHFRSIIQVLIFLIVRLLVTQILMDFTS